MFKKIIYLILFILTINFYSYIYYFPNFIIQNKYIFNKIKYIGKSLSTYLLKYGYQSNIYLSSEKNFQFNIQSNPNLIDIIISNHISGLDFIIILSYLDKYKINNYNFVLKNDINYIPGLGIIMYLNSDIKLNRNWQDDQSLLKIQLDKIINNINNEKQVIIIFPEGTRINNNKLLEGQEFSKKNNLHVFNNLLVPKTKGIYFIINYLLEKNMLGKIWDLSLVIDNLDFNFSLMNDINNIYGIIKEVNLESFYNNPKENKNLDNLENNCQQEFSKQKKNSFFCQQEEFKNKFLDFWKKKDNLLSNFDKLEYEKLDYDTNYLDNIQIVIVILLFLIFMTFKYTRYYLFLSVLFCYLIIIFKIKI
jgi:1-acyl-sn-glycerol-3-phosphate acyltransferase